MIKKFFVLLLLMFTTFNLSKNCNSNDNFINDEFVISNQNIISNSDNNNPNLFINDYYGNYFFKQYPNTFLPNNVKGSCTHVALSLLLRFYDVFWDDGFVSDIYEIDQLIDSKRISLNESSPSLKVENSFVSTSMSNDQYLNFVNNNYLNYLQMLLIKLSNDQFDLFTNPLNPYEPCSMTFVNLKLLTMNYLQNYANFSVRQYIINSLFIGGRNEDNTITTSSDVKNKVIEKIINGIPVILVVTYELGTHAVVAYDYDSENDKIYVHTGWENYPTHFSVELFGTIEYNGFLSIERGDLNPSHNHTSGYYYMSGTEQVFVCPCQLVTRTEVSKDLYFIDQPCFLSWNSLIKDPWYKSINLRYKVEMYGSCSTPLFEQTIIDNNIIIPKSTWQNLLNSPGMYVYLIIYIVSDDHSWDDFYEAYQFLEPNDYFLPIQFKPRDWGFSNRFYNSNEEIQTSSKIIGNLTYETKRLRTAYDYDNYIVLSPRKLNEGFAYFEITFNVPAYYYLFSVCLYSDSELLDGSAKVKVLNSNNQRIEKMDLLEDIDLITKDEGVKRYTFGGMAAFIYGIRFEVSATAIGDFNKGRLCIDDIAFSNTVSFLNPFTCLDYYKTR